MGTGSARCGLTYVFGVTLEAARHKFPEGFGKWAIQRRRWILGNQEEHLRKVCP